MENQKKAFKIYGYLFEALFIALSISSEYCSKLPTNLLIFNISK